jgi:ABC-type multidrug transport system fused ATPase/permease subunit
MLISFKKILSLINERQKRSLFILSSLLFFGMFLEVIGLGILIPTITTLLDPESFKELEILSSIKDFLSISSEGWLVYFFLVSVMFIYLIKSIFLVYLTFRKNRFLQNLNAYISNNLYSSYLKQNYNFHVNRNSSELIKNIQVEVELLGSYINSIITIFIEIGFIVSIILTLLYIAFIGAISVGFFYGILSIFFFQFTKNKIKAWGEIREQVDARISKITFEGLGGIKDLLILGKTSFYSSIFSEINHQKSRITSNQETLTQTSRFYLEFISVAGLISFIIILITLGKATTELVGILGVFVAASFRLLPSLNRVLNSIQTIKYSKPSLDIIYNEISSVGLINNTLDKQFEFKFENSIEFINVDFSFSRKGKVLKGINLKIEKGKTVGIIGESGSGKSTLVDILMGLYKPTKGEIKIDGISGFQLNQSWRNIIGYVSQSIYLTDDSIKNNIALGVPNDEISDSRVFEILKEVQLKGFVEKLKLGIHTKVGERGVQLSGGQIQRLGIARALYNSPDILILDEATSALDSKTEKELMDCIYNLKTDKTIIMIAHRLNTLKRCDFLYEVKSN